MIKYNKGIKEIFMRKSLFLTLILSVIMADFGAFAAVRPAAGRARAASTTAVKPATGAGQTGEPKTNIGNVGTRNRPNTNTNNNQGQSNNQAQNTGANKAPAVAARAATTKKALSMGTKVATATENTAISADCQNAYYGCMDAFCMLDNAAGGRCQCSDRITELDAVLNEIMKIDEQSVRIATEGVEKVQMGEYADQINARAQEIEKGIDNPNDSKSTTSLSKYTTAGATSTSLNFVDLASLASNNIFDADEEDENIFNGGNVISNDIIEDIASKKGDALQKAAARACIAQIPNECKNSSSLLQMAYVQKVRSDCVGYENALKQQRTASQQKLLTAQKAVREAVLEDVRNKNKYSTLGECTAEFDKCMQTNGGCGSDYSNCVADDTVVTMGTDGKTSTRAKTASIKTSASKIGVSANTLAMLTDKAPICEIVLKQCENVRAGVWEQYLKMIAPTLKSQEVLAEQNRRMDCVGNIVDCFAKACAAKWPNQESAEYDMCLSNPDIVQNLCQVQITKCSTSGTGDQVMTYVKAKLGAMRVDACTAQVKACLLSEDRCGKDYSGCVGLSADEILDLCPTDKLVVCMDKFNNEKTDVQKYIAQIAQGLALNIDSKFYNQCQNAANDAIDKLCGSTEDCEKLANVDVMIENPLTVRFCDDSNNNNCFDSVSAITSFDDIKKYNVKIMGQLDNLMKIRYDENWKNNNTSGENAKADNNDNGNPFYFDESGTPADVKTIIDKLNSLYTTYASQIDSDQTVYYCTEGRKVNGFSVNSTSNVTGTQNKDNDGNSKYSFPNLTKNAKTMIADQLLDNLMTDYSEKMAAAEKLRQEKYAELVDRIGKLAAGQAEKDEAVDDINNEASCQLYNDPGNFQIRGNGPQKTEKHIAEYDKETNICTETIENYDCDNFKSHGIKKRRGCLRWKKTPTSTKTVKHACDECDCGKGKSSSCSSESAGSEKTQE